MTNTLAAGTEGSDAPTQPAGFICTRDVCRKCIAQRKICYSRVKVGAVFAWRRASLDCVFNGGK
jgi:hypothetical protein